MTLVAPLKAFGRQDLALAGGKGANLGELIQAGFPVPDGFLITTEAYAEIAADRRIPERPAPEDGAEIRASFEAVEVPEPIRRGIAEAYAELGGGPVAVRSSATAEDLPGAAFAGQQDTYLNIVGETNLIDAVRRCWASLWTDRAIAYRRRIGVGNGARIAVVVQRMAPAEIAGVMFTANPVTGRREEIVVDASSGLGEAVVSGLVTPDHYVLDTRGRVREHTPGRREVVIRAAAGGGVTHDQGDVERLPDAALAELARLGTQVAGHFGRPQDIEWAYAGGEVLLVQARPMTALPPPPVKLNFKQRKVGAILLEYLPVRPYPIDMSTWLPHGPAGLMVTVTEHFGIAGAFQNFLFEEDGVVVRLVPKGPHPTWRVVPGLVRLFALARRYDPARWTDDPRFTRFLAEVDAAERQDLGALPWQELIRLPRRVLDLIKPLADLRIAYLPRSGLALLRLLLTLTLLRRRHLMGDLVHGGWARRAGGRESHGARTRTTDANDALEALAGQARTDPELRGAVEAGDVAGLRRFGGFHAEFQAFLAEYGHRETASPLLVTPPTWSESPETVLGLIAVLADQPANDQPADGTDHADPVAALLEHPLLRRSLGWQERIRRWVAAARAGVAFREDSHFYFTKPQPLLRRTVLEIGARLVAAGVLDAADDVFHLRLEELESVGDLATLGAAERDRLRAPAHARAAKRDELAGVRMIDPRSVFPARDHGDALVSGTPASSGRATGAAKVVHGPADFGKLTSGDVLVCRYTNPSWTPLFQRAAAVVVDSGAVASHAAIVAREYGIPAVMGTATGTSVLTDGQLVTVDGDTGRVLPGG